MNAKSPECIERFIALRSKRTPYAQIEKELNVCRSTLVNWSRLHSDRLKNETAIENELRDEKQRQAKRLQAERMTDLQARMLEELTRRELKDIPTDRLALLTCRLHLKTPAVSDKVEFTESFTQEHVNAGDIPEPKLTWEG